MEDTQTIDWDIEQEEEIERSSESSGCGTDPVGRLRVFSGTYGPEKDFPLYLGKNVVGRMPDCSVALPFPSISKQHAVIEISARDRAPILQDCGSLNGTQILRPPKVLSPGMSHRLRNHELILFADLPCQYRYLDVPLPVVSRAPLTVEETPRVPGDTHATRLPLAEDSEEESDFLHERCVGKESRAITSSPLTTVVPESDDEGPGGSGPSLAFNMDSDTDGGEAGEAPPAVRSSAITEAEQSGGCDDLDLQATQCFVESESLEAVPDVEDEPTQVFPCELPSEPGPPHQSPQAPGALDEPWEVLATQPFCVAKSERPEPLPTATLPEAFGSHLSPPRVMPPDQCPGSPAHTEPLETKGTGLQTVERDRGHADGRMPPAESASGDDLESPDAVPKALAPSPGPHTSQSRKQSAPQALLPRLLSSSPPVPRAGHTGAQDPPGPAQSSGLEPQPSARRWPSRRTPPTPLPSAAHAHCLPPASEPVAQPCLARTRRSSIKTPEVDEPAAPELQLSTSTDHHPVVPKTTPRATRGRTDRSSVKTSVPVVQMAPELQPSMSTHQPDSPEPTPRTTRSRANRSSVETPEVAVHVTPELQLSITIDQSIVPKTMPRAIGNRKDRSSVKTPGVAAHTALELQPSTSVQQPVTAKPVPRATRRQTSKSSSKTIEPIELSATDLEPPALMAQPVNLKTIAQGRLSSESQPPVTTDQTVTQEPDNQASYSRTQRAAGKRSSHSAPTAHQLCSEPQGLSSGDQIAGRTRAAASLRTVPDPCFPQPPEAPTCASRIPKVEAADSSGPTQQLQPAVSPQYKRPSPSTDSPPLLKRPQRGTSQKTVFPKKEKDTAERPGKAEDTWTPGPGKRKRTQMEEELQEVPRRGLRRNKPTLQSAAPKVLFTGVLDARGEQAVLALGGSLASSVAEASHLVTDRICRTVKFLCALGKGIPVLSLEWLQQSRKAGHFLPPDQFVVTDPEQEKNFGFSLRDALSRAQERRLLEGYEIHVTPGVRPPPLQMGEIISCCGGTVLPSMPRSYKPRRVVITCSQDLPRCSSASRAGLPLLSPEFLLTGVLKQEVRPEAFVISTQEQPSA
ncbi:mediator of DNA damage checkpoint protein 1 isoform X5 [Octodon degus]|uniref:Mediator of DNA damage checkpoint protein 1 n=1 Tax=Octodon degus TaxID=10160 RepID=A0A6P6EZB5_OCTDE|nr:mediator of DNA damage checkpoint protein 1 isoform X5 [Octodon degus]